MLLLRCYNSVKSILFVSFVIYIANLLHTLLLYNYTIQMHVEFNSKDQTRAFYRPTQRRIQENFQHLRGSFLQVNECTSEVLLFLWCQNDILVSLPNLLVALLLKVCFHYLN